MFRKKLLKFNFLKKKRKIEYFSEQLKTKEGRMKLALEMAGPIRKNLEFQAILKYL